MMILLSLLIAVVTGYEGFTVYSDLQKDPVPGFERWTNVSFSADHTNRQPNQPSCMWTNLTFAIPESSSAIQLLSLTGRYTEEIPYYAVDNTQNKNPCFCYLVGTPLIYVSWL